MLERRQAGGGADPVAVRHAQRAAWHGSSACHHDSELVVPGGSRAADLPPRDQEQAAARLRDRCVPMGPTRSTDEVLQDAHVVRDPAGAGPGHWAGAPGVFYAADERAFYVTYRIRRP